MDFGNDVLSDFETEEGEKSKYFAAFIILYITWILFILIVSLFDFHPGFHIIKDIDWEFVFILLGLPATGIILLVKKNKFGWAICLLCNSLIGTTLMAVSLQLFLKNGFRDFEVSDSLGPVIILLISSILIGMLISRDIRYYLKISNLNLRDTLIATSLISLSIVVVLCIS
ncbi:MAG: hypothetical protein ABI185_03690 [Ginsengibacter sp.]